MALVLGVLPMTQGCQSSQKRFERRVNAIDVLVQEREYFEAARLSVDLVEDTPEKSPRFTTAVEAQRSVSLASQLDHARALSLADDDDEALGLLTRLAAEYPNSPQVYEWHEKTRRKLARKWLGVAQEALASENYTAARAGYRKVLEYNPDHSVAPLSLEDLDDLKAYRAKLADKYYHDGVQGVVNRDLTGARGSFEKNLKYHEENPKAMRRMHEVDRARASARAESARTLVEQELYSAAAKEYARAAKLDPDNEEYARNETGLRAEARALVLLNEGQFQVLRGEIDRAEELFKEGASMTALQSEAFTEAITSIGEARVEKSYVDALDLEQDFRFPEAIEAYGALLETRDFYKDARARIDVLEGYVASAGTLYAEAAAAPDDAKRLELLQQIDVFWPEYEDVAEQIRELKKK